MGNVKIISIPAGRSPFISWCWSVVTETVFRLLGKYFSLPVPALSQAVSRRSNLIIKELQKVSKPDWVIGHNPGAMWPAIKAAKKFTCNVGFDVEDYHPGEGNNKYLQKLSKQLMTALLPQMNYVSFAAPLILQQVKRDINIAKANWFTVLNYFPASEFGQPTGGNEGPVKLVWFSQNISAGRGLELILPFVKKATGRLELHLIGNPDPYLFENYFKHISNIIIHAPMNQKDLHHSLGQYDIGLALEPAKDINNGLALSNKLLACLQAGLFVVATNTTAQASFLKEYPAHGLCFDYKTNNAETVFEKIIEEINIIRSQKDIRYKNFENRNWETASEDLLNAWNK